MEHQDTGCVVGFEIAASCISRGTETKVRMHVNSYGGRENSIIQLRDMRERYNCSD